jgi:exodeoxyribonuclease V beta subunit
VVYWGAFWNHETCALAQLLHHERGTVNEVGVWSLGDVGDRDLLADLRALERRHPALIAVREQAELDRRRWTGGSREQPEVEARVFARARIDRWWRRASYSSLTRQAGQREVEEASPEAQGLDMDPDMDPDIDPALAAEESPLGVAADPEAAATRVPADAPAVPLCEFPRGTAAGTFLHRVLELYDFTQVGEPSSLEAVLRQQMPQHGIPERWLGPLRDGLAAALSTPLGGPLGDTRLCDVPLADRLDEMAFEFPVAGGYELVNGRDHVRPRALADVFRRHRPPTANLSAGYLEQLGALGFGPPVRGFLAGAIDLIFRRKVDGHPRWFVADYKSNWIGASDWSTSTVRHYDAAALAHAMGHRHYYLQYHLYTVALHRYLRWRLPDYDYERDFGGVYYMFLRGMVGPTTPREGDARHGVFFDRPPLALVDALDTPLADPQRIDPKSVDPKLVDEEPGE